MVIIYSAAKNHPIHWNSSLNQQLYIVVFARFLRSSTAKSNSNHVLLIESCTLATKKTDSLTKNSRAWVTLLKYNFELPRKVYLSSFRVSLLSNYYFKYDLLILLSFRSTDLWFPAVKLIWFPIFSRMIYSVFYLLSQVPIILEFQP